MLNFPKYFQNFLKNNSENLYFFRTLVRIIGSTVILTHTAELAGWFLFSAFFGTFRIMVLATVNKVAISGTRLGAETGHLDLEIWKKSRKWARKGR